MATHLEILGFLRPDGGYIANGDDYAGINFLECEPFTKAEYEAAFDLVDAAKAQAEADKAAAKAASQAKLAALGLTVEDLKVLGLG